MNQPIAFDPVVSSQQMAELGVRGVELDELLSTADFVSIHCPLNEHTRGLIGAREIGLMKGDAYLLNTARGGIVDEDALCGPSETLNAFRGGPQASHIPRQGAAALEWPSGLAMSARRPAHTSFTL